MGSFHSLLARAEMSTVCHIHCLPAVSGLAGRCIGTKSEVKPWESGLEMSMVFINHPSLLYAQAFHLQHLLCHSQRKFFNPQFISSWCSLCCSRNPYKGDRKLENQTPGIVPTRVCSCTKCYVPPGDCQVAFQGPLRGIGVNTGRKEGLCECK